MDTLIYIANESQILPLSGAVASYKVRWQPDLLRVFYPKDTSFGYGPNERYRCSRKNRRRLRPSSYAALPWEI